MRKIYLEYNLTPDQLWNMDEKGAALGVLTKARVLVRRGTPGFQTQGTLLKVYSVNFDSFTIQTETERMLQSLKPSVPMVLH
jgi:hypothetical protein